MSAAQHPAHRRIARANAIAALLRCAFPQCQVQATTRNRSGQTVCAGHQEVVVCGSYVDDKHADGGHG